MGQLVQVVGTALGRWWARCAQYLAPPPPPTWHPPAMLAPPAAGPPTLQPPPMSLDPGQRPIRLNRSKTSLSIQMVGSDRLWCQVTPVVSHKCDYSQLLSCLREEKGWRRGEWGLTRQRAYSAFHTLAARVWQNSKSISDHLVVIILVCFGSIISEISPKKLGHFAKN